MRFFWVIFACLCAGGLTSVLIQSCAPVPDSPNREHCDQVYEDLQTLEEYLQAYQGEHNEYPKFLTDLKECVGCSWSSVRHWDLEDPWGRQYEYGRRDGGFLLKSHGPNRRTTVDDILLIREVPRIWYIGQYWLE